MGAHQHSKEAFINFWEGHRWYRECNRMFDGGLIQDQQGNSGAGPGVALVAPRRRIQMVGAPPSPSDPVRRKPPGLPTVWDKLNDDVADFQFGFFADAVVAVGLKGLFQSAGPFTVFAPTNRAWYSALVSLGVTKEASVS